MVMGIGTKFQRMTTTGTDDDYEDIGKITEIGDISVSRDTSDITAFDNVSGYREYDVGLKDGGELTMTVRYRPDGKSEGGQHEEMRKAFEDGTREQFRIVFPIELDNKESPTCSFESFVTSFGMPIPLEEHITQTFTLKITGPIIFEDKDTTFNYVEEAL